MTPGLQDFAGRWSLNRRIVQEGEETGRLRGTAVFRPDGAHLIYEEAGVLKIAGSQVEARQSHHWRADGHRIHICFKDGRPFHGFALGLSQTTARHECPPDTYDVRYDFSGWPHWSSRWTVTGPRKAYRMVSRYAPVAEGP